DRALQIYEDSRRLSDKQEQLIKQKAERLNVLNNELNKTLELPTTVFVTSLIDLKALLASIKRVDANSAMLADARIPVKLSETMAELIEQHQFSSARQVGQMSSELFPESQELKNARRNLELRTLRFNRATRISELQQQLDRDALNSLDSFADALPVIQELQQLEPDNDRLNQLQQQLSRLLTDEQQRFIDTHAWQEARDLILPFVETLAPEKVAEMEQSLKESLAEYQRLIDKQVADIDADILAQRLEKAEQRIGRLKPTISDQRTITAVYDRLALAWIKLSRHERDQHNWDKSSEALARVAVLEVSPELQQTITYEQQQLEQSKQMTEQELAASVLAGENSARQTELQTLQSELISLLQSPELSDSSTRKAQSLLDRIDTLKGDPDTVQQGRERIVQRYTEKAVAAADSDIAAAISILQDGKRLLPGSSEITVLLAQLQLRQENASEQQKMAQLESLKQQFDQLLVDPEVTPEWEKSVGDLLSRLKIEQKDPVYIQGINTRLATIYNGQAKRLSEQDDFNVARDFLRLAAQYDSSLDTLNATDEAISKAEVAFRQKQAERKSEALISGLKQTFDTQIQANDLSAARQTYTRLKSELGEEDPFVTQQAPQTFQTVYLRLADQLAARKRFSQAEKLMDSARDLLAEPEVVDQRIAEYQNGARLYHVTQAIKNPDIDKVVKATGLLLQLQPHLTAEKYQQLNNDLQNAVIGQINSLTSRSPVQAKNLLRKAQQLFPENSPLQRLKLSSSKTSASKQVASKPVITAPSQQSFENENGNSEREVANAPAPRLNSATRITSDRICTAGLAGKGIRSAAVCWDMLAEQSKAPFMIVVPGSSRSYAISKFEISRSDYNLYCKLSGSCSAIGGAEKLPATGLSQVQINKYIVWLSNTTGYQYRLPGKAQWMHAATATGSNQPQNYNCRLSRGAQILKGRNLVSVQQGRPNAWGLVNYLGNAQELVKSGSGLEAVGGSYRVKMSDCSVSLSVPVTGNADEATGFRLVREL
ncbi:MAG: SUMF1/EgtB/PvdO family nonheme iron enzyme, partial [Amphritea sp.]|nr:SUMF1/EgtB/PvdO family nonheme iron enzyme [Amphritea sp.]